MTKISWFLQYIPYISYTITIFKTVILILKWKIESKFSNKSIKSKDSIYISIPIPSKKNPIKIKYVHESETKYVA